MGRGRQSVRGTAEKSSQFSTCVWKFPTDIVKPETRPERSQVTILIAVVSQNGQYTTPQMNFRRTFTQSSRISYFEHELSAMDDIGTNDMIFHSTHGLCRRPDPSCVSVVSHCSVSVEHQQKHQRAADCVQWRTMARSLFRAVVSSAHNTHTESALT